MIHKGQLESLIRRVLAGAGLPRDQEHIDLLMETAAHESLLGYYLTQLGGGPAKGLFQMEPATFETVRKYAINTQPYTVYKHLLDRTADEMEWDHKLAILMARLNYLSKPGAIPTTRSGRAAYWKKYWNTYLGKGTIKDYMSSARKYLD
jgi:hypothetical protein